MPFAEAFAATDRAPARDYSRVPPLPTVKAQPSAPGAVEPSLALQAALSRFGTRARAIRATTPRGAPMPAEAVKNWSSLNLALDDFLSRGVKRSAAPDVVRARVTADAELELDARHFGDLPSDLADAVVARVTLLAVRMAEVRRARLDVARSHARFSWPLEVAQVTSLFGDRLHPVLKIVRPHQGIDLAARPGQQVFAAAEGVVLRAGPNGEHGLQVEVHHAPELVTRYSHLEAVLVEPGARVKKGEAIGLAGRTGRATGVHLHFEVWRDGTPVDPLEELGHPFEETPGVAAR